MKFNLESFNDLGRAGFGPNHTFDTERDRIFECTFNKDANEIIKDEVTIGKVEDLFPYLWSHPWAATGGKDYGTDYFYGKDPKPWWCSERDKGWKKFCEERLPAVKEAILNDNRTV